MGATPRPLQERSVGRLPAAVTAETDIGEGGVGHPPALRQQRHRLVVRQGGGDAVEELPVEILPVVAIVARQLHQLKSPHPTDVVRIRSDRHLLDAGSGVDEAELILPGLLSGAVCPEESDQLLFRPEEVRHLPQRLPHPPEVIRRERDRLPPLHADGLDVADHRGRYIFSITSSYSLLQSLLIVMPPPAW